MVTGSDNVLAPNLVRQMRDLRNAYTQIANVYKDKPVFSSIAGAESDMKDQAYTQIKDWKTFNAQMAGYTDEIWDAIFGDATAERTAFNADLAAYENGNYLNQKQRYQDNPLSAAPTDEPAIDDLNTAFTDLLVAIDDWDGELPQNGDYSSGGKIKNLSTILAHLQTRLENKINDAMGVDGLTESSGGSNKYMVKQVIAKLVNQLGEDFQQWRAFTHDIIDAGYGVYFVNGETLSERVVNGGSISPIVMGTPRASHIDGFNFDMDLLRTDKAIDGKDGIALA
jgi:hypothetical protein